MEVDKNFLDKMQKYAQPKEKKINWTSSKLKLLCCKHTIKKGKKQPRVCKSYVLIKSLVPRLYNAGVSNLQDLMPDDLRWS